MHATYTGKFIRYCKDMSRGSRRFAYDRSIPRQVLASNLLQVFRASILAMIGGKVGRFEKFDQVGDLLSTFESSFEALLKTR